MCLVELIMSNRNRIPLYTRIAIGNMTMMVQNFWLHEFEMKEGTVLLHPSVPVSLEYTRYDLCEEVGEEVCICITGSTRSEAYNEILGESQGWIDEGGTVSRNSKHLPKYGGIAVDWYAYKKKSKKRIPQKLCGEIARRHFDYVKDNYRDGHIHADNRLKGK